MPPLQVSIKYQQKSQMKSVSHKFKLQLQCQCISNGSLYINIYKDSRTCLKKYELILPMPPLFHCFSVKFNTPSQPKKVWFIAVCTKWPWVLWILSETNFNQSQLKLCYLLTQTYISNISTPSDHGHLCWASRKTSFQCLHLHRAATNTRYEKMSGTSLLAEISVYCFDLPKTSW